jgi:hypothetical protein
MMAAVVVADVTFNCSWTAVVPVDCGDERRLRIRITRRFVEGVWLMRYNEPAVRRAIANRADELAEPGGQAYRAGKREIVLGHKEPRLVTNVPA